MTFQELQNEVVDQMGLGTGKDFARAGRALNTRYKWVMTTLGLNAASRSIITANTVEESRDVTFTAEKLYSVFNTNTSQPDVLTLVHYDEMRNLKATTGDEPKRYAIKTQGASTVVITLDKAAENIYALSADALVNLSTLSGTGVPAFAGDFHDVLIYGAKASLYELQGKYAAANEQEERFEKRLAELRFFLAKSAYLDQYQGKTSGLTPTTGA